MSSDLCHKKMLLESLTIPLKFTEAHLHGQILKLGFVQEIRKFLSDKWQLFI